MNDELSSLSSDVSDEEEMDTSSWTNSLMAFYEEPTKRTKNKRTYKLAKRFEVVSAQKIDGQWMLKQMRVERIDPATRKPADVPPVFLAQLRALAPLS